MKITKSKLIELGASSEFIGRFILFTKGKDITVDVLSLIGSNIANDNLVWLAGNTLPRKKIVEFCIDCAEAILPNDPDPRINVAIVAAKYWLNNPTEENRLIAFSVGLNVYELIHEDSIKHPMEVKSAACNTTRAAFRGLNDSSYEGTRDAMHNFLAVERVKTNFDFTPLLIKLFTE